MARVHRPVRSRMPAATPSMRSSKSYAGMVESRGRKAAFLREALRVTGGAGEVHHRDIGDYVDSNHTAVDCVTARAVASLNILLGFAEPLVTKGAKDAIEGGASIMAIQVKVMTLMVLIGADRIDKLIEIDQSPIGRSPRSTPATYIGLLDDIRRVFAGTRDAKVRGYKTGRFSPNVRGGRCEHCEGLGTRKIQMNFLPDLYLTCEVCRGKRFNPQTLEIRYRGHTIADTFEMRVDDAVD